MNYFREIFIFFLVIFVLIQNNYFSGIGACAFVAINHIIIAMVVFHKINFERKKIRRLLTYKCQIAILGKYASAGKLFFVKKHFRSLFQISCNTKN